MKKRVMVIGPGGSGKTSLIYALTGVDNRKKGRHDLIYSEQMIDVPGAYLENPGMYSHIIALSQHASQILMLTEQSGSQNRSSKFSYPPGFASVFNCPVIGVMTKVTDWEAREEPWHYLGINGPVFYINTADGRGIEQLKQFLFQV